MSKINLSQLSTELEHLTRDQELYKVLKKGLSKLGYWKNKKRGVPIIVNLITKNTASTNANIVQDDYEKTNEWD